jgi:hypothetical protein
VTAAAIFIAVYAIGFMIVLALARQSMRYERTARGKAVLIQMTAVLAPLWPIALIYFLLIGLIIIGAVIVATIGRRRA